jgi:hypothetical protein
MLMHHFLVVAMLSGKRSLIVRTTPRRRTRSLILVSIFLATALRRLEQSIIVILPLHHPM